MWLISVGHPLIQQRFFAATDQLGRLCWVDVPDRALSFRLREEAERFAALNCIDDEWAVARA